jgi:proteasome lid subunit RPN8/RPN11
MLFFKKNKIIQQTNANWKIKNNCLDLIIESAKSIYPKEFGALLRVDDIQKSIITEIILLPGTVQGETHTIFKLHMMPIDFNIVGTIHSHPSPFPIPSDADIELFRKHGRIHIIIAKPYTHSSWRAYDYNGKEIKIEIV